MRRRTTTRRMKALPAIATLSILLVQPSWISTFPRQQCHPSSKILNPLSRKNPNLLRKIPTFHLHYCAGLSFLSSLPLCLSCWEEKPETEKTGTSLPFPISRPLILHCIRLTKPKSAKIIVKMPSLVDVLVLDGHAQQIVAATGANSSSPLLRIVLNFCIDKLSSHIHSKQNCR